MIELWECHHPPPPRAHTRSKLSWAALIWFALESEQGNLLPLKGDLWAQKMSLAAGLWCFLFLWPVGLEDDGEGEGKYQGPSGSVAVVRLGDRCGWAQHLGLGVEESRPSGHSWLWTGPADPVLSANGLVLAPGGPRLRQRSGKRKICYRRRYEASSKGPFEGKLKSAGLSHGPCLPGGT